MPKLNGARSRRSRSRKRQFGETKPNFGLEVRKEWEDFIKTEGPRIKEEDPEFYYHLIGKKLPKKYQDPFRGTKPTPAEIIPVKVKTDEEIKKENELKGGKKNFIVCYLVAYIFAMLLSAAFANLTLELILKIHTLFEYYKPYLVYFWDT